MITSHAPSVDDPPPLPPPRPHLDECCKSACDPCIFDMYEAAMERFRADLNAWQERHPDRKPRND